MSKFTIRSAAGAALATALGLSVCGCSGFATNRQLDSIHQPVVEHVNYSLDLPTGPEGMMLPEQRRL